MLSIPWSAQNFFEILGHMVISTRCLRLLRRCLYAGLLALIFALLSFRVIGMRRILCETVFAPNSLNIGIGITGDNFLAIFDLLLTLRVVVLPTSHMIAIKFSPLISCYQDALERPDRRDGICC